MLQSAMVLWAALLAQNSAPTAKPNIILIVADDLGARDLGFLGSSFHKTPALDQLANDGTWFKQAYSACPVCSPSRAAILTGRHPARFGLTDWLPGRADLPQQKLARPPLPPGLPLEAVTMAEMLAPKGYTTGHIGKWHLGGDGLLPTDQGFQTNVAGDATGTPRSYMAPFRDRQGNSMPGLEQSQPKEYLTDRLTTEAEKFIEKNREKPFFLYLAHYAPHTPLVAKKELVEKFNAARRPGAQDNPVYAAMLASLDESIARVRSALKKSGIDERTTIVFTSDNGGLCTLEGMQRPATTNAPLRDGKGWLYEGGIRVPLVIAGPGIAKGASNDSPVSGMDITPTLLGLMGEKPPEGLDGANLSNLLHLKKNEVPSEPERTLWWHYPHYSNQMGRPGAAIRKGRWKYITYFEKPSLEDGELFDLQADAGEKVAPTPKVRLCCPPKMHMSLEFIFATNPCRTKTRWVSGFARKIPPAGSSPSTNQATISLIFCKAVAKGRAMPRWPLWWATKNCSGKWKTQATSKILSPAPRANSSSNPVVTRSQSGLKPNLGWPSWTCGR